MIRKTAVALLAAAALALAGCSSPGDDSKPTPTVTVTKAPKLSASEQRKACVEAWAKVLHDNADADQNLDEPNLCASAGGDHYGMYWDGMMQRNKENQDAARDCLDDPTCTSLPVP
ncbi:hypothetical protein ABT076_10585 [Streptomyces sp. NPDC002131]|uniref:hypothetical protein n=1 Tax=Streptomyces sp. NPDC002131 TaxID=3154535 RepID=UPI0033201E9A